MLLIEGGHYAKVASILAAERSQQARKEERAQRRADERQQLLEAGLRLGVPEDEIHAAVEAGRGAERVAAAREAVSIRFRAEQLGCEKVLGPMTSSIECAMARARVRTVSDTLNEAARLGARGEVSAHFRAGDFDGALRELRAARQRDETARLVDDYRLRVEKLDDERKPEALALVVQLGTESRAHEFRKLRHRLDTLLGTPR
jgi:hypothetical protein